MAGPCLCKSGLPEKPLHLILPPPPPPLEPDLYGEKWKILVAFKCLLEIQRRAANIDSIGMYFYTKVAF